MEENKETDQEKTVQKMADRLKVSMEAEVQYEDHRHQAESQLPAGEAQVLYTFTLVEVQNATPGTGTGDTQTGQRRHPAHKEQTQRTSRCR
ncbi:hypothetical protein SKAU_G00306560 [Synaphobranchus kaupii]|uniref:Uncharacterized protein n=1 Tax=Synaphobranchus kaupii TaxID=118154 RepID=A0A9Q1EQV7_SYNKA|nr:hypothetical protein SKAU_G00306560 [Synaphobranchus kaupii]